MQVDIVASAAIPVTDNGGTLSIDDGAGSITVDGTVTANAGTGTFAVSAAALPLPSGAATQATLAAISAQLPAALDGSGNLKVAIISGAGSGGTSIADDAAFTVATTSITPVGGVYKGTVDSVDDGDAGAFAMTAKRAQHVMLVDSSGNELSAGAQYAEDAAHASGDSLMMMGAVRRDTAAVGSGTDGDNSTVNVDGSGRLWVNGSGVTQPVSDAGGSLTVDSAQLPAALVSGRLDVVVGAALPAGTNNIGDVDVLTLPNVTLAAGTNTNEVVGDAAHDAAIAGNPVRIAGRGMSADYTAVATGDTADLLASLLGKQVVLADALPANTWSYAAPAGGLVTTSGVTAKAAAGAGIRNYVTKAQIMNSHQTIGSEIVIRDGAAGTVLWRGWAQFTGGGAEVEFKPPLRGTANTLIEIGEITATGTAGVLVNLQGFVAAE
jgi:hypothetical protein